MPAGRGNLCDACYWTKTCRKRIDMDAAAFSHPKIRNAFVAFGQWLECQVGAHKCALTIHRYLSFFTEFEARWMRVPTYVELLDRFGAEGLRRVRLPMRWLGEAYDILPNAEARETDSERRRIRVLLEALPTGSLAAKILADYQMTLMSKVDAGRMTIRSVRLALRPAVSLLIVGGHRGHTLPNQEALDRYLLAVPGQTAAVTGFLRFLSKVGSVSLVAHVDRKEARQARRRAVESQIMQMAKHPEDGEAFDRRWIALGLAYFHDTKVRKRELAKATVVRDNTGMHVNVGGSDYFLPDPAVTKL